MPEQSAWSGSGEASGGHIGGGPAHKETSAVLTDAIRYCLSMTNIEMDLTTWPIVEVLWPKDIELEAFQRHCARIEPLFERQEPFAMVIQLPSTGPPSPIVRRAIADFDIKMRGNAERYVAGMGFVVLNSAQRAVMTVLSWLTPSPGYTRGYFKTKEDAIGWARARLQEMRER